MKKVFISHASSDQHFIEQNILPAFNSHGIEVWYCKEDIRSAEDWENRIRIGLNSCDWFLIVISENAINSDWVKAEVHWAFENRKKFIVPVLIAKCDPSDLHIQLSRLQYIDFRHNPHVAREELLAYWGIVESDEITDLDAASVLDRIKGNPVTVVPLVSLQRRAAKLSGERQMIGASSIFVNKDVRSPTYIFTSTLLHPFYYIYAIKSEGEYVFKLLTDRFPAPNKNDKTLESWSTCFDKGAEHAMVLAKRVCPLEDLKLAFKLIKEEDYQDNITPRVRKVFFSSNHGNVEIGVKHELAGEAAGYVFFRDIGKAIKLAIDTRTHEIAVIGQSNKPAF
ncbi:MAG: hypothetical protein QOG00_3670 [Pyrinomonadaceae bacterium]|nr:hypothetical protein [Pyrinomonadaceae bacterium]MDX6272201.1 hypothetical protein [Acidobacteriota bacterium]